MYLRASVEDEDERERDEVQESVVRAAVLLVADGRYPRVALVNIPDAEGIAADLAEEAEGLGVVVDACVETVGAGPVLRISKR